MAGFQPDDVLNGLRATVDERESQRQQLRADPDTRRRRRRTTIIALAQLPIAILLINLSSLTVRWSLGTKVQVTSTQPASSTPASFANLTMVASGLSLLGVSFLLLARSPFRMPVGERLFRLIWLGPPGRAFLRFSFRGVARRAGSATGAGVAAQPVRAKAPGSNGATAPPPQADRVASLEARVSALERWKEQGSR